MAAQFSFSKAWALQSSPSIGALCEHLGGQFKLRTEEINQTEAVLRGGSQFRTRLLGGWFISPTHLPKTIRLRLVQSGDDARLEVGVDDALGPIAVRDQLFRKRYEQAAADIFTQVDHQLS